MNFAHLHLLLNHFPIIGTMVGLGLFLISLGGKNGDLIAPLLGGQIINRGIISSAVSGGTKSNEKSATSNVVLLNRIKVYVPATGDSPPGSK